MKKLIILAALSALFLAGCASTGMRHLAEAGAFEQDTCEFPNGTQGTGEATCQRLAQAYEEERRSKGRAEFVAAVTPPSTDDPSAWWRYYDSVEDGPAKIAWASAGAAGATAVATPRADLARTALAAESQERQAWISGGLNAGATVATAGLNTIANIVESKFAYKERRAMWAAFSRPSVSVSGFGEGGGTNIINVDGAVGTDSARVMANRSGYQSGAHDDAGSVAGRNVTDPTQLTGVCDQGDSQCDGETFLQQQNPTQVDTGVFGGGGPK